MEVELPPQLGQFRPSARTAEKKPGPQLLFHVHDALLHGRHADAEATARRCEGAGFGHGPEILESFRRNDHAFFLPHGAARVNALFRGPEAQAIFNMTTPDTMSVTAAARIREKGSSKSTMPVTKAPAAPMPVHTA